MCLFNKYPGKRSDLQFSRTNDRKKEKSTVSFTHVQNIVCSQTRLDGIAHEYTIICRQLFPSHVANEKKEKFASNDKDIYYLSHLLNKIR